MYIYIHTLYYIYRVACARGESPPDAKGAASEILTRGILAGELLRSLTILSIHKNSS